MIRHDNEKDTWRFRGSNSFWETPSNCQLKWPESGAPTPWFCSCFCLFYMFFNCHQFPWPSIPPWKSRFLQDEGGAVLISLCQLVRPKSCRYATVKHSGCRRNWRGRTEGCQNSIRTEDHVSSELLLPLVTNHKLVSWKMHIWVIHSSIQLSLHIWGRNAVTFAERFKSSSVSSLIWIPCCKGRCLWIAPFSTQKWL